MNKTETSTIELCKGLYWCSDYKGRPYCYEEALNLITEFHGHLSPGLVIGVKMVSLALARLNLNCSFDAVCETRGCLPDAVQILTPCTIGNGRLKIIDMGRYAITFYDRTNGMGVRVSIDPNKLKNWPEYYDWFFDTRPQDTLDSDRLIQEIRRAGDDVLRCREIELIV